MTCRLVTPWWTARTAGTARQTADGTTRPTAILDWQSPEVASLLADARAGVRDPQGARQLLQRTHRLVAAGVRPVYALDDSQPVSRTLARGSGSCSQRLAVLEAVARAAGVPTRCRGLLVDGRFWRLRFRPVRFAVPDAVLLAWPEFRLHDGEWLSVSDLFGPAGSMASARGGFTNADGETLFDAVARAAVDWDGSAASGGRSTCDLSAHVVRDLGYFDSRDDLFARHGQTLCAPARALADPFLRRWAAGTVAS